MNHRLFALLIPVFLLSIASGAQESKSTKKVVIIKKTNENGKITETRTEAEGKDADELIKNLSADDIEMMNVQTEPDGKNTISITTKNISDKKVIIDDKKDAHKEVNIYSENFDGLTKEHYKIIKKDGGQEKIIEWDGRGPMPAELEKELGNININKNYNGERMEITIDNNEGENDVVIVNGDPQMKRNRFRISGGDHPEFIRKHGSERPDKLKADKPNTNKVSLGVMIEDTDQGVTITDIIDGSAAVAAGLRRGDVILKINDKYIFTSNGLLDALRPFNPDDKIKVRYIRDGKEKSSKTSLKARI
jgi:hypothetical protein